MKSFRRLVLRRPDAPKRTERRADTSEVTPVMNGMRVDIPCEVIDLSGDLLSAPRFGYLAHRSPARRR